MPKVKNLTIIMPLKSLNVKTSFGTIEISVKAHNLAEWEITAITGVEPLALLNWAEDTGAGMETIRAYVWDEIQEAWNYTPDSSPESNLHPVFDQIFNWYGVSYNPKAA